MPRGIFITYVCDGVGSSAVHMKNAVKAMSSSAGPPSHSHMLLDLFRWHRAFVDLTGSTFVAKRRCANPAASPSGLILDLHRVSGALITKGETS